MLSINTNLSSLIAQNSLTQSTSKLNQAIERMSTGFKINHASDNAANYNISTNMTTKLNSYMVAEDNTTMAIDMVQTADAQLSQINDRIARLRYLQEQAQNNTYGEQSLNAINTEVNSLVDEINRLYLSSDYNGIRLFVETETNAQGQEVFAQEDFADEGTTFAEMEIDDSSFTVYSNDGSIVNTYDTLKTDTIGDFLSILRTEGFEANIRNGEILISSTNKRYIGGDLANALGISTEQTNFVESTTQSFDTNIEKVESIVNTTTILTTTTTSTTITETLFVTTTTSNTVTETTFNTIVTPSTITETLWETITTTTTTTNTIFETTTSVTTQTNTIYTTTTVEETRTIYEGATTNTIITTEPLNVQLSASQIDAKRVSIATSLASGETYYITTADDLVSLSNIVNSNGANCNIELLNDIDMTGVEFSSIGTSSLYAFSGVFNGNGHKIVNLTINEETNCTGLFGYGYELEIKNLSLVDCDIAGVEAVGGFVGYVANETKINNCYVSGKIEGSSTVGGLVGQINYYSGQNIIDSCIVNADIIADSDSGGFIGSYITDHDYDACIIGDSQVLSDCELTGIFVGSFSGDSGYLEFYHCGYNNIYIYRDTRMIGTNYGPGYTSSSTYTISEIPTNLPDNSIDLTQTPVYGTTKLITTLGEIGLNNSQCFIETSCGTIFTGTTSTTFEELINYINTNYSALGLTASFNNGILEFFSTSADYNIITSKGLLEKLEINKSEEVIFPTVTLNGQYTDTLKIYGTSNTISDNMTLSEVVSKVSKYSPTITEEYYVYFSDSDFIGGYIASTTTVEDLFDAINSYGNGINIELKNGVITIINTGDVEISMSKNIDTNFFAQLTDLGVTFYSPVITTLVTNPTIETVLVENIEKSFETQTVTTTTTTPIETTSTIFVTTTTSTTSTETIFETTTTTTTQTNTVFETTTTSTTQTSTLFETVTMSTTQTETTYSTSTVSATGSTKLSELGVNKTLSVTVYNDGTRSILFIEKDKTFDEFYSILEENSITTDLSGSIMTFTGSGDSYIKSKELQNLLKLGSLVKNNGVLNFNTDSKQIIYTNYILGVNAPGQVTLQVGINSDKNSQIDLDVSFKLSEIQLLRNIGKDLTTDYLSKLDNILERITEKQTEFGAVTNRLESVLDEIAIQYDNLVSSRSTLRDADIAEVSSKYIRAQILQQASATLIATANQSPSIALQLI